MAISFRVFWALLLSLALTAAGGCGASIASPSRQAGPPSADRLREAWARIATESGAQVSASAVEVEAGVRTSLDAQAHLPMGGTVQLAIAATVLDRVDRAQLHLEDAVRLDPRDMRPGPLAGPAASDGITTTVGWLLQAMIVESDNTAADALLRVVGGAQVVTRRLRAIGIEGIRIDRSELELDLDLAGASQAAPADGWTQPELERRLADATADERRAARLRFFKDPRDTATPDAMANLLVRIASGQALSSGSTARLVALMQRAKTGPRRLGGALPEDTVVAHKAGTRLGEGGYGIATNDVGLIVLPSGHHLAIAVFVSDSSKPLSVRERTIAEIARAAYDHWAAR